MVTQQFEKEIRQHVLKFNQHQSGTISAVPTLKSASYKNGIKSFITQKVTRLETMQLFWELK